MNDIWVFGATVLGIVVIIAVAVWCWPARIPKGRSVDEIRQRIEDEDDRTRQ